MRRCRRFGTNWPGVARWPSTGQAAQALAVQGMAGVGKTVLARLLAQEAGPDYPDGVIWEEIGPDVTRVEQVQAILRKWADYATGYFALPENMPRPFTFEADAVRALLADHPRLLVVLDNVWSLAAIEPLRDALPQGTHLILTTRSQEIARTLGGGRVEVGKLSVDEAVELFQLKLGWRPNREDVKDGWAFALMEGVERHALGLDVALGVLEREGGDDRAEWQAAAARLLAAIRSGDLGDLTMADDVSRNVQAVLLYSYRALDEAAQRRFRRLGSFAPEAAFTTPEAAAAWGCDAESARRTLVFFVNAALLERRDLSEAQDAVKGWQQHALLRGLARALLRQQGEGESAAAAHARAYDEAMRRAEDGQRYYEMLPALPQLAHAFEWAVENDLELALNIAANCANLQKQFGQSRQAGEWAERALAVTQQRAAPATQARAWGHRANRLSELAILPGEDRRQRLPQALRCAAEAVITFEEYQQAQYLSAGQRTLRNLRRACGDDFAEYWAAAGLGDLPDWLDEDEDDAAASAKHVQTYLSKLQAADAEDPQVAAWAEITEMGEALLAAEVRGMEGINWSALREQVASNYNTLGNALDKAGDKAASLAAFERAIELQPDFAMWHRNRAGMLIELGRLDEARAAIDHARSLEPDAPRLAQLEEQLAAAQGG
jgi:tetratricopeptide (TPR) repeat protein